MERGYSEIDLAEYIDHSVLQPTATLEAVQQACGEAVRYDFPAVCVYPWAVRTAREALQGKAPQVCAVIGFPSGATTRATKVYEALEAVENGARELDVVINLGWLKGGDTERIYQEMAEICEESGQTVKAILEMAVLTEGEKRLAAEVCLEAGVSFLKTSTGWFGGATVADVRLLKEISRGQVGIKASGGIRTPGQALELIQAGATRLGTSRGVDLLRQREAIAFEE
ncbi:deoxyribose-phosphate aldolase [Spirulina subsalsa]|uniref:deoxyribose-phosphate aldolase n=1 Tax=Spirulina subsalsa TaxID=54311 RepID=UPI000317C028|nr:deoxyribose-phosphate aldolase [Spirulina subsalsa]